MMLCSALLTHVIPVRPQSIQIEGHVRDADTNQPLSGANIQIHGTGFGVSSDAQGRFVFADLLTGEYTLLATYIGYAPQRLAHVRVQADQPVRVDFHLSPQVLQMPLILVTADQAVSAREPDQVVNAEQIRRSNAASVGELLQNLGGVTVEQTGGSNADFGISIRGSKSNQVLILIDGVRLTDPSTGKADLSAIPISAIERIEVHKGGRSDQYGSGALAGVVHIVTRRATENRVDGKIQSGSFADRRVGVLIQRRRSDWNLLLSGEMGEAEGTYSYSFAHAGSIQKAERMNADSRDRSVFVKIGWDPALFSTQLSLQLMNSERGLPGRVFELTPFARARLDRLLLRWSLRKPISNGSIDGSIAWRQESFEYSNRYDRFSVPLEFRSVPPYWTESDLEQLIAEIKGSRRFSSRLGFRLGVDTEWLRYRDTDHFSYNSAPIGEANLGRAGLWTNGEYTLFEQSSIIDRCELGVALRLDWAGTEQLSLRRHDRQVSPTARLSMQKKIGFDWHLLVQTGRSFRLPGFSDLFFQQFRIKGNPALKPEKMTNRQADLSAGWSGPVSGKIRWSIFDDRIDDLIIWRMGNFAVFSPVNTDARLQGQEIEIEFADRSAQNGLALSYLYLDSENLSEKRTVRGKKLPYRAEHNAKVGLHFAVGKVDCLYDWRWIGKRFVTEANTVAMDDYQLHDVTIAVPFSWLSLHHTLRLSISNLLDTPVSMFENAPLPGRQWRLSLDCSWQ
ncbi:TonB-dependent receptor [candidate division KSB1 bacterium]|nr:TonB-dependent receptor [candidate division KSB1 bacterium]